VKSYSQVYEVLHEVNRLCSTDADLKTVLEKLPKRSRLGVFETIACIQPNNHKTCLTLFQLFQEKEGTLNYKPLSIRLRCHLKPIPKGFKE